MDKTTKTFAIGVCSLVSATLVVQLGWNALTEFSSYLEVQQQARQQARQKARQKAAEYEQRADCRAKYVQALEQLNKLPYRQRFEKFKKASSTYGKCTDEFRRR